MISISSTLEHTSYFGDLRFHASGGAHLTCYKLRLRYLIPVLATVYSHYSQRGVKYVTTSRGAIVVDTIVYQYC